MSENNENNITGRDNFIIAEALATAIVALTDLPIAHRPSSDIEDMKRLFTEYAHQLGGAVARSITSTLMSRFGEEKVAACIAASREEAEAFAEPSIEQVAGMGSHAEGNRGDRGRGMSPRYVRMGTLPKSVPIGRVLCHNHVQHTVDMPCALNGFRAWTDTKPPPNFVKRPCGWSGLPHFALRDHVEVVRRRPSWLTMTGSDLLASQRAE